MADQTHSFIRRLEQYAEDEGPRGRAALAALRRGLGKEPGEAPETFPYLVPLTAGVPDQQQDTYYLVASLFALHPQNWVAGDGDGKHDSWRRNFGASMQRVEYEVEAADAINADDTVTGTERRFVALLNSDTTQLPERLRHAVSLCRSKNVPVDWVLLLDDLLGWESQGGPVQRRWARAFWTKRRDETAAENAVDDETPDE